MSAVEVLSSQEDSMNMCGRGNGKCKSLLVVVWLFLALGWIGTGAVAVQEARSKAEVLPAGTAKVSPRGATFTVPAGWSVETAKLGGVDAAGDGHALDDIRCGDSGGCEGGRNSSVDGVERRADASGEDCDATAGARRMG